MKVTKWFFELRGGLMNLILDDTDATQDRALSLAESIIERLEDNGYLLVPKFSQDQSESDR